MDNTPATVQASTIIGTTGPLFLQYPILVGANLSAASGNILVYITGGNATTGFTMQDVNLTAGLPLNLVQVGSGSIGLGQTVKANGIPVTLPSDQTIPVSGNLTISSSTITVNQGTHGTDPWEVTLAAGSASTPLGSVTAYEGGTWTVQPGNTPNTVPWLTKSSDPTVTTGVISAADAACVTTTNSNGQTVITGTPTANSSVSVSLNANSSVLLEFLGSASATYAIERAVWTGSASTYVPFGMELFGVGTALSSVTITDGNPLLLRGNAGGLEAARVRCTSYTGGSESITWTPGYGVGAVVANQGVPNSPLNPWPVTPGQGTLTNRSGTITSGGTAQTLAAVNANRKYLFIQNVSTGNLWFNFTTTAVQSQPSILLLPNASVTFVSPYITTEAVSVIGATTSQAFTAKEG